MSTYDFMEKTLTAVVILVATLPLQAKEPKVEHHPAWAPVYRPLDAGPCLPRIQPGSYYVVAQPTNQPFVRRGQALDVRIETRGEVRLDNRPAWIPRAMVLEADHDAS